MSSLCQQVKVIQDSNYRKENYLKPCSSLVLPCLVQLAIPKQIQSDVKNTGKHIQVISNYI